MNIAGIMVITCNKILKTSRCLQCRGPIYVYYIRIRPIYTAIFSTKDFSILEFRY